MLASYTATCLRNIPIETRHPGAFFADVHAAFRRSGSNRVLPADTQRLILDFLKDLDLPNRSRSSSFNSTTGRFDTPLGGYGPPQSENGSFCFHNKDSLFPELLPNVDQNRYNAPDRRRHSETRRRRQQRLITSTPVPKPACSTTSNLEPCAAIATPSIMISDVDAVKVKDIEQRAALTVETTGSHTLAAQPATDIVAHTDDNTASGINIEAPTDKVILSIQVPKVEADNEDSGICMQDPIVPDTVNPEEDISKFIVKTDRAQSKDNSQSADHSYGTQAAADPKFILEADSPSNQEALPSIDSPSRYESLSKADKPLCKDESLSSLKLPRKIRIPKSPSTLRRSSRLSALHIQFQPAQRSPLRHIYEPDVDTEPKAKRTKDCQD